MSAFSFARLVSLAALSTFLGACAFSGETDESNADDSASVSAESTMLNKTWINRAPHQNEALDLTFYRDTKDGQNKFILSVWEVWGKTYNDKSREHGAPVFLKGTYRYVPKDKTTGHFYLDAYHFTWLVEYQLSTDRKIVTLTTPPQRKTAVFHTDETYPQDVFVNLPQKMQLQIDICQTANDMNSNSSKGTLDCDSKTCWNNCDNVNLNVR